MTAHKHLKERVRARMDKTGESYTSARRQVLRQPTAKENPTAAWHFPGTVATTTALRILLTHAGVRAPHSGEPFSEAMLFGIAGGIGFGMFSFVYEKEDFASFFVAGRHSWQDHVVYFSEVLKRFGIKPHIQESSGAKSAEKQLRDALTKDGMAIAWVDMAHLPHRGFPPDCSWSSYHVITIYRIDDASKTALIGDLYEEPVAIPLTDLAMARDRIKKDKHRVLSISTSPSLRELKPLVWDGLRACHQGLLKQRMKNFTLEAIRTWADRLHDSKDKESWERLFTPGRRLWNGLKAIHEYIDYYGTGGGLCRPLFANFLTEAADALKDERLRTLAERYAALGRDWTELAQAALPKAVPPFRRVGDLLARRSELTAAGAAPEEIRQVWHQLQELDKQMGDCFPLTGAQCASLRAELQKRVLALYEGEKAAHEALGALTTQA